MSDHIDHGDVEALAAILESERIAHCRKRGLCFGLFLFSLVMLVFAVVIFGVVFVIATNNNVSMDQWLPTLQLLPPLRRRWSAFLEAGGPRRTASIRSSA